MRQSSATKTEVQPSVESLFGKVFIPLSFSQAVESIEILKFWYYKPIKMDIFCRRPRQEEPSASIYQPSPRYVSCGDIQRKKSSPTTRKVPTIHDDVSMSSWANMDSENPGGSSLIAPKGHVLTSDASISLNSWANMDTDNPTACNLQVSKDCLHASDGFLHYSGQKMISTKEFRGKINKMKALNTNPSRCIRHNTMVIPENDEQSVSISSWANLDITEAVAVGSYRNDVLHQSDSVLQYNWPRHSNLINDGKLKTHSKKKSRSQSLLDQAPSKPEVTASRSQSMDLQKMNQKGKLARLPPTARNGTGRKSEKRKVRVPFLAGRRWSTGHSPAENQ